MSLDTYEGFYEFFKESLPPLAWTAGKNVLDELTAELWEIRERLGGRLQMVEKAVGLLAELDRAIVENRSEWLRLRRDVATAEDDRRASSHMTEWWGTNSPHRNGRAARRLLRRNPPELDACREVYLRIHHKLEQKIEFLLRLISSMPEVGELQPDMARGFLDLVWAIATRPAHWSTRLAAFEAITQACKQGLRSGKIAPRMLQQIVSDETEFPWVRSLTLRIQFIIDFDNAVRLATNIFQNPRQKTNSFIARRAMLEVLCDIDDVGERIIRHAIASDPSPAVRQKAALRLLGRDTALDPELIETIARDDSYLVRGAWALALENDPSPAALDNVLRTATAHLPDEADETLAFSCLRALAEQLSTLSAYAITKELSDALVVFASESTNAIEKGNIPWTIHSWWSLCIDLATVLADHVGREFFFKMRDRVAKTGEAKKFVVKKDELPSDLRVARRAFSCIAAVDFGLYVKTGRDTWVVCRGQSRGWALWRAAYELRHPAYDKRQGHSHLTGLSNFGDLWFPSLIMAEVTRTRVPGEKVYHPPFSHSAPMIPGPTEAVGARGKARVDIVMPGAEVTLREEGSRMNRAFGNVSTSLKFGQLDDKRHNALRLATGPAIRQYLDEYQKLTGQSIKLEPRGGYWSEEFGLGGTGQMALVFGVPEIVTYFVERMGDVSFFITPFTNELWHLGVFLGLYGAYIVGQQVGRKAQIRKLRDRLPLCIGGWGSRGKSGTERLKAALFHGLGYQVFSKTTGTLPMFVSSLPGIDPVEVPIFRPYDKATIWEQIDMLKQAVGLNAQVFLWECMALNPRYVNIMSHDWMRDDLATVTNTYPDHEDIQGPTGYDVAKTISGFIPPAAKLVTSESQMYPILDERAKQVETINTVVSSVLSYLIPYEFLERFPYLEHPLNIALVLTLAEQLGIDSDMALMTMGDHIIADVGALRKYPTLPLQGARFDFTNIMSANERAGFISSYERIGFHEWTEENRLTERITLIVNNREDRPARSHVFAKVIVEDTAVDGIVIVGSGAKEFAQLLHRYLEEYAVRHKTPISTDPQGLTRWLQTLFHPVRRRPTEAALWPTTLARWLRTTSGSVEKELGGAFEAMLSEARNHRGGWSSAGFDRIREINKDGVATAIEKLRGEGGGDEENSMWVESAARELAIAAVLHCFHERCDEQGTIAKRPQDATDFLKLLVESQIHVIENPGVPAAQIMQTCVDMSIPATVNHLVGMQNIKGPGLVFINLWSAMETMQQRTRLMLTGSEFERGQAIEWLLQLKRFSPYEAMIARDALTEKGGDGLKQLSLEEKALLDRIIETIDTFNKTRAEAVVEARTLTPKLVGGIDRVIDFRDSISRRQQAGKIMRLLSLGLISHQEAVSRMNSIYARQKKGRLAANLAAKD